MHDIRLLRDAPEAFDAALGRRGIAPSSSQLLAIDEARRALIRELQELQARRNVASKEIGQIRRNGGDAAALTAEVQAIKERMPALEAEEAELGRKLDAALASLPNHLDDAVPAGADEADNVELRRWGTPRSFDFEPLPHYELGERMAAGPVLRGMDFERAAKIAGARFVVLAGPMARLERALAQFMLDLHTTEHGFVEVQPPYLVGTDAVFGTGQLPKFADDLFRTTDDRWLIPTSEVPLTNLVAGEILDEAVLPLRLTACTPCFRSEAGSAGRDTRGMLRQHQFSKVEMVSVTVPEASGDEQDYMTACAEAVLQKLELPYRVVVLCSGDTGFSAVRTHDIEVWVPAQQTYREISSVSNTRDFQARRMRARCRKAGERDTRFVHTLNGSGVAVGRALIALVENHQQADGSIRIPLALRPYLGGAEAIGAA
ncbi:serine--tRNA ligase [Tistrella bauzanensis]|uniref:Serine--tRNA ligase n=1 Tax=Tistrella bauzanensis TaxID=657419 RepID=A0ABQ1I9I1_9PROT|nr:serine--tRNA ligase [Tistrella bauzanensis]GGB27268.1 serine--tRNA ligase [Tistrella bauzanensis]